MSYNLNTHVSQMIGTEGQGEEHKRVPIYYIHANVCISGKFLTVIWAIKNKDCFTEIIFKLNL